MAALDDLLKLGEFPAVRAARHWVAVPGNDTMVVHEAEGHIVAALEELAEFALGRVEKSWLGLHCILDEIYPRDIFTGASGDPGPKMVVLTRALGEAEARAKKVEEELERAERERDEARRKRREAQRLADKLTKALTQIERHPHSKLDDVAAAYFALGEKAARGRS